MSANLFFVSLLIALVGPVIAISYLKPILYKVLRMLCDADGGAEFWIRCAYLLAVSGTLLLMLSFGEFSDRSSVVDTVRRSLWLVLAGVFVTVAIISRNVWTQVRQWVAAQNLAADIQAARIVKPAPAASAVPAESSTDAWPA
jgi:quinol-cytochrome oxidoreductase complex cytochrome b subunit